MMSDRRCFGSAVDLSGRYRPLRYRGGEGVWLALVVAEMGEVGEVEMVVWAAHRRARFEVDGRRLQHAAVDGSLRRHALTVLYRLRVGDRVLGVGGRVGDVHIGVRGLASGIGAGDRDGVTRDGGDRAESGRLAGRLAGR